MNRDAAESEAGSGPGYTGNARDTIPCYCWSKTPHEGGQPAAMVVRDACPGCGSIQFKKNGHIHSGKQNHQCKACGRQFVASAEERIISDEQRTLIEHLLRERISLRGICRAVGGQSHVVTALYGRALCGLSRSLTCPAARQSNRLWCFGSWKPKPMSCGVLCRRRPISNGSGSPWTPTPARSLRFTSGIAVVTVPNSCGPRSRWSPVSRPGFIRINMTSYKGVIPAERHKAITKQARKTNHIERFNNTLAAAPLPSGPRNPVVLQETGPSHRCHQVLHLPLQSHEGGSITSIALPVLRHTFTTLALLKGISLAAIQKILGHDRLSTTAIYLNLTDTHVIEEYAAEMVGRVWPETL